MGSKKKVAKKKVTKKRRKAVGTVKDNMKPSKVTSINKNDVDLTKKDEGIFGRLRRKAKTPQIAAKTFADSIVEADDMLQGLIAKKRAELDTEKGQEEYNRKALAHLTSMEFHLEQVCNHAADYSEIQK